MFLRNKEDPSLLKSKIINRWEDLHPKQIYFRSNERKILNSIKIGVLDVRIDSTEFFSYSTGGWLTPPEYSQCLKIYIEMKYSTQTNCSDQKFKIFFKTVIYLIFQNEKVLKVHYVHKQRLITKSFTSFQHWTWTSISNIHFIRTKKTWIFMN